MSSFIINLLAPQSSDTSLDFLRWCSCWPITITGLATLASSCLVTGTTLKYSPIAAADCDNFHTAYARATTVTPVAIISPQVLQNNILEPLYLPVLPSSHPHCTSPPRTTTNPASPMFPSFPLEETSSTPFVKLPEARQMDLSWTPVWTSSYLSPNLSQKKSIQSSLPSSPECIVMRFTNSLYLTLPTHISFASTKTWRIPPNFAIRRILASQVTKTFRTTFLPGTSCPTTMPLESQMEWTL